MTYDQLVEAVARALCVFNSSNPDFELTPGDPNWHLYEPDSLVAITVVSEVLQKSMPEMLMAAYDAPSLGALRADNKLELAEFRHGPALRAAIAASPLAIHSTRAGEGG